MTAMIEEKNDQNQKPTKKPLIYYAMIASLIIMLLNIFLFPRMLSRRVEEAVSYTHLLKPILYPEPPCVPGVVSGVSHRL